MKLLLFLITITLFSCMEGRNHPPVVTYKGSPNEKCICHFNYIGIGAICAQEFYDSCFKYNIGDTIYQKIR